MNKIIEKEKIENIIYEINEIENKKELDRLLDEIFVI